MKPGGKKPLVELADGYLLGLHKKLGECWQDRTYTSASNLRRYLYGASTAGFAADAGLDYGPSSILSIASAAVTGMLTVSNPRPKAHSAGMKYMLVGLGGIGGAFALSGLASLAGGIVTGDSNLYSMSADLLPLGIGISSFTSAIYLGRSDFDDPPKRMRKEEAPVKASKARLIQPPKVQPQNMAYVLYENEC